MDWTLFRKLVHPKYFAVLINYLPVSAAETSVVFLNLTQPHSPRVNQMMMMMTMVLTMTMTKTMKMTMRMKMKMIVMLMMVMMMMTETYPLAGAWQS